MNSRSRALICCLLVGLMLARAEATTYTWDASGGSLLDDGPGTWSASGGTNWFNNSSLSYGAWGNGATDIAVFGVGNGPLVGSNSVGVGDVTANRIVFNSAGTNFNYDLTGGTITFAGPSAGITVNTNATIDSLIAGTGGLQIDGTGSLNLTNSNSSYTGPTLISGGTVSASLVNGGVKSSLGAASSDAANLVLNGGVLKLLGASGGQLASTDRLFSVGIAGGTIDGSDWPVIFTNSGNMGFADQSGPRTLTLTGSSNGSTLFGKNTLSLAIGDQGGPTSLVKSGGGTWVITGSNTYTGTTTINIEGMLRGTLQLGNGGTSGTLGSGNIVNNGSLVTYRSDTFELPNSISGTGIYTQTGTGTAILSGNNTFTGTTYINNGTLQIGNGGTSGSLGVSDIQFNSGPVTFANGSANLAFNRSDDLTVSNNISGSGSITQSGLGTTTLTGSSSGFRGAIYILTGKLKLGSALGNGSNNPITIASAGTLAVNGRTYYMGSLTGTGILENGSTFAAGLEVGYANTSTTFSGTIRDGGQGSFSFTKTGTGTMTLSGNNTYTGSTIIGGDGLGIVSGVLRVDNLANGGVTSSIGASSAAASNLLFVGGVLQYVGAGASTDRLFSLGYSLHNNDGGIDSSGTGTLSFTNTGSIGFIPDVSGYRVFTLSGTNTGSNLMAPSLSSASIVKAGTGTWVLAGNNSLYGLSVDGGLLVAGSNSAFGTNSAVSVSSGATLRLNGFNNTVSSLSGAGLVENANAAAATLTLQSDGTFSGALADGAGGGSLSLAKLGTGKQVLSGTNSYSGSTTIVSGILAFATKNSLYGGDSANWNPEKLSVMSGATAAFNVGGSGEFTTSDITSLSRTSSATGGFLNGSLLGLDTSNAAGSKFVYDADLGDNNGGVNAIGLSKLGSGSLMLGGTNTYTGPTNIIAGVLIAGSTSAVGSKSATTISTGAVLQVNGNDTALGSLAGSGTLENGGAGSAMLTIGTNGASSTFSGILRDGAGGATLGLTKTGAGSLVLSGQNNYTGPTIVSNGALQFVSPGSLYNGNRSLWTTANFTVHSGATATFSVSDPVYGRFSATDIALISQLGSNTGGFLDGSTLAIDTTFATFGSFTLPSGLSDPNGGANHLGLQKLGSGALYLNGISSYSGNTSVMQGVLSAASNDAFSRNSALYVAGGASVRLNGNDISVGSLSGAGVISNEGYLMATLTTGSNSLSTEFGGVITDGYGASTSLTKIGSGTLTLSGANTYTGTTMVNGGTLIITGSINSPVTVNNGAHFINNSTTPLTQAITINGGSSGSHAIISGNGAFSTAVALDSTGITLSPGNSPGLLSFTTSQTWSSFTYDWETNDFVGKVAGASYDQISIDGTLLLTGGTGSYVLRLLSLTANNSSGFAPDFGETAQTWQVLTTTGGIAGFNPLNWTVDASGFSTSPDYSGTFSLQQTGNNLSLLYTPVPEPGGVTLVVVSISLAIVRRRR